MEAGEHIPYNAESELDDGFLRDEGLARFRHKEKIFLFFMTKFLFLLKIYVF